jgi:NadR type nicotinamide-nucleotide adenylyltransferase
MMKKVGLTLGKYAPFHKGHEYVIETALKEMEYIIVIIYNASDFTEIPTIKRAEWIQNIFPNNVEIIIAEDGPQETGYTKEIIEKQNAYIKNILQGKKIHTFYSSESYGQYVSDALNSNNRIVDLKRLKYPINATMIRKNHKKWKQFVSKCVYDTIKVKYYFVGAPSTGKTSISKYCSKLFSGAYCHEYGRDYWFKFQKDHRLSMSDLEIIAVEHDKLEEKTFTLENDSTFIDTCVLTTFSYALYYFGKTSKKLRNILDNSLYKYKNVFLCDEDIPFEDTWDRSGPKSRAIIQDINKDILEQYGINYILLSGSPEDRLQTVKDYITKLEE